MEVISYGKASSVGKDEFFTRSGILGSDIAGAFNSLEERLDALEDSLQDITRASDKLIVQNAVNIMKANEKLNIVAQSKKEKMQKMIFDDLLDSSGIDAKKSTKYKHDLQLGKIVAETGCVIYTTVEELSKNIKLILVVVSLSQDDALIEISRDGGQTWEVVTTSVHVFQDKADQDIKNKVCLRLTLSSNTILSSYGLSWT